MKSLFPKKYNLISVGTVLALSPLLLVGESQTRELVETLLENEQISQEQAERILGSEKPVTATPEGKNFRDFHIRGRIQTQFGYTRAKDDDGREDYSTLELRRVRLGVRGTLLQNVRAQIEANFVPNPDNDLTVRSAFLQWREHEAAFLKVGYDRPAFGDERTTGSGEILTVERSHLTDTIISADMLGASLEGEAAPFGYGGGVYTNRDNFNAAGDARYLYNASLRLELDPWVPEEQRFEVRTDVLLNDDSGGNFGFKEGYSLSAQYGIAAFDLRVEYLHANGFDDNTVNGWYVMPAYSLTETFQLVGRYEWMRSDADGGIRSPGRYTRRVSDLTGDRFQGLYAGANYYFSGHANKVMFGAEVSELETATLGNQEALNFYGAWRVMF